MTEVTESEPRVGRDDPGVFEDRHRLPAADAEKRVREALPQVRDCVVVAARRGERVQADVLLMLHADADPIADYEPGVRAALDASEAETIRRVFVVGVDRDFPYGVAEDRDALARWHLAELIGARLPGLGPGADPVPVPDERVRVAFAGEGSGSAELVWGQREIWQAMTRQGNWLPLGGWKRLDPGTTVEDVADELAYLHSRFPSMRTRLRFDASARPRQELAADGWTELEVFDAPDGDDVADQLAAAVDAHYQRAPYDLRTEWPVRMAVVRQGGAATRMVVVMHHLALDGGGAEIMIRDVAVRATEPPAGLQPLQLAEWQNSPAGRKHTDRAMRHFGEILRSMPVPTFPPSEDPRRPPWWSAEFESSALRMALATLVDRTGADPARVMVAVYGIALARVTGVNPVLMRPVIGNRFRRQLADVVCHASQAGIVLLDVSGGTVEDVIERTGPASMNALKHGYYDPEQLDELARAVGRERGVVLDIASFINDRRAPAVPETIPAWTADDYAEARARSGFRWSGERNDPVERMFIHIDDAGPDAVLLSLEADTRALAPGQIERLAHGIEEVAVNAALRPGLETGVVSRA
ncbi:condensation domain-containing protein [Catenulispora subtropica]|uniref:Condensation domain-containing protein n=1 Tax=Catenulispora subtropica TaxID=450798 RepID=A0ABN2SE82_9ACTN